MLQRQSKNNDLVIQVEGAGISKLEYYTDEEYKYVTDYSETVYIPSEELRKMNDGLLKSTVYIAVDNDNFSDGTQDRIINLKFDIWIGSESTSPNVNEYYTKDEIDSMLGNGIDLEDYYTKEEVDAMIPTDYLTEIPSEYITEDELNSRGFISGIPEEYVTDEELNNKGYLTEHLDISNLATKDELYDDTALVNRVTAVETSLQGVESILLEING